MFTSLAALLTPADRVPDVAQHVAIVPDCPPPPAPDIADVEAAPGQDEVAFVVFDADDPELDVAEWDHVEHLPDGSVRVSMLTGDDADGLLPGAGSAGKADTLNNDCAGDRADSTQSKWPSLPRYRADLPPVPQTRSAARRLMEAWERSDRTLPMPPGLPDPSWWPPLKAWPKGDDGKTSAPLSALTKDRLQFNRRMRKSIIAATGPYCRWCGHKLTNDRYTDETHPRHGCACWIVPESRGGLQHPLNVVVSCQCCLQAKGDHFPDEWLATIETGRPALGAALVHGLRETARMLKTDDVEDLIANAAIVETFVIAERAARFDGKAAA